MHTDNESAHSLISRAGLDPHAGSPRKTATGRWAWGLSAVLHPLLLPTYLFLLLFTLSPALLGVANTGVRYRILSLLAVCTFVIPILSIYMLFRLGSIQSLEMDDRQDRVFPFISTTLFYVLTTYLFVKNLPALYLLTVIMSSITASLAAVTAVSFYWKISAHSVGIGGIAGCLIGLYYHYAAVEYFYPMLLAILLAGLLISARLHLNAHTPAQVLAGAMVGLGVNLGAILIFA